MDPLRLEEYRILRETIRTRGGLRLALSLAALAAWGLTLVAVLVWLPYPIAGSIPLLLLAAGFEINRMLHLGVERIGRYLQVFFEDSGDFTGRGPSWESAAMALGPTVPGAGGHPLLLPLFILATVVNMLAVVLPDPTPLELGVMTAPHASFVIWMAVADRAMRQQRPHDLARFRELRSGRTEHERT
jgi:hypothetical protein